MFVDQSVVSTFPLLMKASNFQEFRFRIFFKKRPETFRTVYLFIY